MPQEMLMFQLLNQTGSGWLTSVLLLGLLLVLLFRQDRVYNWALFRISCWLLACSIVIPPILNVLMNLTNGPTASFRTSPDLLVAICVYALGPILLGISVICGLMAMIPGGSRQQFSPAKHPLE